jgi:hypothetical protein
MSEQKAKNHQWAMPEQGLVMSDLPNKQFLRLVNKKTSGIIFK